MINTVLCIGLSGVCLFLIILQHYNRCPPFSIVQIQNYVWLFAFVLYSFNFLNYKTINHIVILYSFLYLLFFNLSSLGKHYSLKNEYFNNPDSLYSLGLKGAVNDSKRVNLCAVASIVAWLLSVSILKKSLPILLTNDLSTGLNILRNSTYSDYSIFSTNEQMLMTYIIRPIFTVCIILFAEQVAVRKINIKLAVITILDSFLLVLMTAGRALIVSLILYITFAVIIVNGISLKRFFLQYRKYIIPGVVLLIVIVNIVTQRINRNNGIFVEFLIYYFSGIPYFSELLKDGLIKPFTTFGGATFAFVFDAVFLALKMLGLNIPLASQIISHLTARVIEVAPGIYTNATASTLLAFYLDFGALGMIASGTILGYFTKRYENNVVLRFNPLSFGRYLFLVVGIASSIQNYYFGNITTLMTWLFLGVLLRSYK